MPLQPNAVLCHILLGHKDLELHVSAVTHFLCATKWINSVQNVRCRLVASRNAVAGDPHRFDAA